MIGDYYLGKRLITHDRHVDKVRIEKVLSMSSIYTYLHENQREKKLDSVTIRCSGIISPIMNYHSHLLITIEL